MDICHAVKPLDMALCNVNMDKKPTIEELYYIIHEVQQQITNLINNLNKLVPYVDRQR